MTQSSGAPEQTDVDTQAQSVVQSGASGKKMQRRRIIRWSTAAMILVGLAVGIPFYLHAIRYVSTDDAFINGSIVPVSPRVAGHVAKVYVNDNQRVKAGDLLVDLDPRDYQARLDAARASLQADEAVNRARQIDVQLIKTTAAAAVDEAVAAVASSRAMVQNAQALAAAAKSQHHEAVAKVAFAKASLAQSRAEFEAAQAKYRQTAQDLERYRQMARSNTISPQQLDHALTAERTAAAEQEAAGSKVKTQQSMVQQAEAALKASEDNVRQAQAQVAARQAQLEQATARLTSARTAPTLVAKSNSQADEARADTEKSRAEVEQARLNLSYTHIRAPADGFVTGKNVDPGAFVQQGQSLMAIVSPQVWVTANFKETQLTHMRPGQPATVAVDTYPGTVFHGHVDSIQRGTGSRFSLLPPENATGNFVKVVQRIPVKIVFDRPEELARQELVPGMSVVPEVNIKARPKALAADEGIQKAEARPTTR